MGFAAESHISTNFRDWLLRILVGAVPSAASARPPTNLRVPAHPRRVVITTEGIPGRLGMRMVAAATGGHLDRNDILAMPTVGAGSSRFSRRFPRPLSPTIRVYSPRIALIPSASLTPSASHPPHVFLCASLSCPLLFFLVNSRYLCGVPRWWGLTLFA